MSTDVIAAVLLAALLHATWNAIAKASFAGDPLVSVAAIAIGGAVVALPLLALTGLPATTSHPHVVASGAIHVVYFLLVGLAYRGADYSAVYPITRGSSPLATTMLAAGLMGEAMSLLAWSGVGLLCIGILVIGTEAMRRGSLGHRALTVAGANVVVIVTYTLLDGAGARLSENPAGYVLAMMALTGLMMLPAVLAVLGAGAARAILAQWRAGLIGGPMVSASYGTALWAMTKAPIGTVAALRETSVLFAAAIGALFLRERFGPSRWMGAALIMAGLAAIRFA